MKNFLIQSDGGDETIQAKDIWDAAGQYAAQAAGFDTDEPCWEPFSFLVDDEEFFAEIESLDGVGTGKVKVSKGKTEKVYDDEGCLL